MKTTPNLGLEIGGLTADGGQEKALERNFEKIDEALGGGVPEAPLDGQAYNRKDGAWAVAESGGLTNFDDTQNADFPNDLIPFSVLSAKGNAENISVAIAPKGTGALSALVTDDATEGWTRGAYTVDWQRDLGGNLSAIALGDYSVIGGGQGNSAGGSGTNGTHATVAGGKGNSAGSAYSAIGGGESNTAGKYATVPGGYDNSALRDYSIATGYQAITTYARSSAHSSGRQGGGVGTAQKELVVLRARTFNASPTRLTLDAQAAAGFNNELWLPPNSTIAFDITLTCRVPAASHIAAVWNFKGAIKRTTSTLAQLVGSVTKTVVAQDAGTENWDADVTAETDGTYGYLAVTGTEDSGTGYWCATVEMNLSTVPAT